MKDPKININDANEIIIVVPPEAIENGELEIDLDELGIDVESLNEDVDIIVQVEGLEEIDDDFLDDEDYVQEPNEWYFDDDPYGLVYYEFPDEED